MNITRWTGAYAGLAALFWLATAAIGATPAARAPFLAVTLAPHAAGGTVDYVDVTVREQAPEATPGQPLLNMGLVVASVPTARYDGEAVTARDDKGALPLTLKDGPQLPYGQWRDWLAGRATSGDVTYRYRAYPRQVTADTKAGPMFDLREQDGGMNASGMGFLALPPGDRTYRISLHWDLSAMPAGSRGVWSLGEGGAPREGGAPLEGKASLLAESYYAAGAVRRYPESGDEAFGIYWFGDIPYDMNDLGAYVQKLHAYMSGFFGDAQGSYRIFVRKTPYWGANGTALAKSFMFSYGGGLVQTLPELKDLLSHEMTHNWPSLQNNSGADAWYEEGTAEYYSNILSMRAGVISPQELVARVNERAVGYYTNPLQSLAMKDALKIYWQSSTAQRVPYGRGFLYFASQDGEIRKASGGKRSLDDLVREMYAREAAGKSYDISVWLDLLTRELGPKARRDYDDMMSGKRIVPPDNAFGPCMKPVPAEMAEFDLGFSESSLRGDRILAGLVAGSNAAKAGLKNGDHVLKSSTVSELLIRENDRMKITVERDGKTLNLDYLPRGKPVSGYRWVLVQPDGKCHV